MTGLLLLYALYQYVYLKVKEVKNEMVILITVPNRNLNSLQLTCLLRTQTITRHMHRLHDSTTTQRKEHIY